MPSSAWLPGRTSGVKFSIDERIACDAARDSDRSGPVLCELSARAAWRRAFSAVANPSMLSKSCESRVRLTLPPFCAAWPRAPSRPTRAIGRLPGPGSCSSTPSRAFCPGSTPPPSAASGCASTAAPAARRRASAALVAPHRRRAREHRACPGDSRARRSFRPWRRPRAIGFDWARTRPGAATRTSRMRLVFFALRVLGRAVVLLRQVVRVCVVGLVGKFVLIDHLHPMVHRHRLGRRRRLDRDRLGRRLRRLDFLATSGGSGRRLGRLGELRRLRFFFRRSQLLVGRRLAPARRPAVFTRVGDIGDLERRVGLFEERRRAAPAPPRRHARAPTARRPSKKPTLGSARSASTYSSVPAGRRLGQGHIYYKRR